MEELQLISQTLSDLGDTAIVGFIFWVLMDKLVPNLIGVFVLFCLYRFCIRIPYMFIVCDLRNILHPFRKGNALSDEETDELYKIVKKYKESK